MYLFRLALASLANRRFTALLTIFAIALSACLLLAVERVRTEAKASFASTISGTDLIVGARSGSVNLLLYSVFRIGNATNNIRWDSYRHFAENPRVKWAIPISLGDSHRGYRVMGTDAGYFEHYRYGRGQELQLAEGRAFGQDLFDVVLGAEVAEALHYRLGEKIVLAHGVSTVSLVKHDDKPFTVVGILQRTGTPVDRTLHISLAGIPGVALQELWGLMGTAEKALFVVSLFVVLTGLIGMLTAILTSLNERRREMAILRSVGARPWHIFGLLLAEAFSLALAGVALGLGLLYLGIAASQGYVQANYGIYLPLAWPSDYEWSLLGAILAAAVLIGCVPAWRAYRQSLADGLSIRL